MKIKRINYYSVPRSESSTCECCGKSIQNICSVTTLEGEHFNFGTTCFEKIIKDRLQSYQRKEMNKAIKYIKSYCKQMELWKDMTEDKYIETHYDKPWENYDDINTFEKYKDWMVNEFFPYRLSEEEKRLERFSKIDFHSSK